MDMDQTKLNQSLENLIDVVRKEEREKLREEIYEQVKRDIIASLNGIQLKSSAVYVPSVSVPQQESGSTVYTPPSASLTTLDQHPHTEPVKKKDGRSKPRTPAQIEAAKANMAKARKARMAKLKAEKSKARGGRKKKARAKA